MRNNEVAHERLLPVFAALGDRTRLVLIERLSGGQSHSIAELREGLNLSHQGVTKHLRVLEQAGLVMGAKVGRERRYQGDLAQLQTAQNYLQHVAGQWQDALTRLKDFVESE
ncbi:MAG: metalloregulator ArsR/SmtB family transcription factor [Pseudomonadales bacterium]|nr:metalloregulator ArsR/SmtB family transcription factor [Pseudomonadales bacterium]